MDFAVGVFQLTETLPPKEDYGLTSQMRRAALSISNNIAEGFGRNYRNDKLSFYYYARGSANETKNQLLYGELVGYFNKYDMATKIVQINSIIESLNKLIRTLKNNSGFPQPKSQP